MKATDKKFLKALGEKIRHLREEQGISQDQLGYECEIHRISINRIEQGKISVGIIKLRAIARAFEISLKELLDFKDEEE